MLLHASGLARVSLAFKLHSDVKGMGEEVDLMASRMSKSVETLLVPDDGGIATAVASVPPSTRARSPIYGCASVECIVVFAGLCLGGGDSVPTGATTHCQQQHVDCSDPHSADHFTFCGFERFSSRRRSTAHRACSLKR